MDSIKQSYISKQSNVINNNEDKEVEYIIINNSMILNTSKENVMNIKKSA